VLDVKGDWRLRKEGRGVCEVVIVGGGGWRSVVQCQSDCKEIPALRKDGNKANSRLDT
jgi:hypothetical protein